MASLQSNLEYLSSKIDDSLENKKAGQTLISDRKIAQHDNEGNASKTENSTANEYPISEIANQSYTTDYNSSPNTQFENENAEYTRRPENTDQVDSQIAGVEDQQNYGLQDGQKYEEQEYPIDQNYPTDYGNQEYDQYGQYDPSLYQQNPNGEEAGQHVSAENAAYQQDQQHYENYPTENYPENLHQQIPPDQQEEYTNSGKSAESNLSEA